MATPTYPFGIPPPNAFGSLLDGAPTPSTTEAIMSDDEATCAPERPAAAVGDVQRTRPPRSGPTCAPPCTLGNPAELMDAWRALQGHAPARRGEALARWLSDVKKEAGGGEEGAPGGLTVRREQPISHNVPPRVTLSLLGWSPRTRLRHPRRRLRVVRLSCAESTAPQTRHRQTEVPPYIIHARV